MLARTSRPARNELRRRRAPSLYISSPPTYKKPEPADVRGNLQQAGGRTQSSRTRRLRHSSRPRRTHEDGGEEDRRGRSYLLEQRRRRHREPSTRRSSSCSSTPSKHHTPTLAQIHHLRTRTDQEQGRSDGHETGVSKW
jgi:hypothetical protein